MKISTKGRYALAAMISLAQQESIPGVETLAALSGRLGLSKLYLEQVFSLLRRAELVLSVKGAQGGYRLARGARDITGWDILSAVENSLFDQADATVADRSPGIERAMRDGLFTLLDQAVRTALEAVSLHDLAEEANLPETDDGYIYII